MIDDEYDDRPQSAKVLSGDKVEIFGTVYQIVLLEDMLQEDKQYGGLDVANSTIFVDLDLDAKQHRCETLVHELVHAYAFKLGDLDEKQVVMITSCVFDFIARNQEIAADLIEMAKKQPDLDAQED